MWPAARSGALPRTSSRRTQAGEVLLDIVRARFQAEGSALAETAAFLPVLHCGGSNAFVDPLADFHHLFVNPRARRLRESHFRVVCGISQPRLRLALLKAAYGCPVSVIRGRWIDYFGSSATVRLTSKRGRMGARGRNCQSLPQGLCRRIDLGYIG